MIPLLALLVAQWLGPDAPPFVAPTISQLPPYQCTGTGCVSRPIASKLGDVVSVTDYAANGVSGAAVDPTGGLDSTAGIQAAITAAYGKTLIIPNGTYLISSTLNITDALSIVGTSSSSRTGTSVSKLLYTGTGAALSILDAGGTQVFNLRLSNFRIDASGSATSSATAIGLQLQNSQMGLFENLTVTGFGGGIGILVTATSGQLGASNSFIGCWLFQNLVGYKFDGFDATHGDYDSNIFGGAVIGASTATVGSKGLWVTQYAAETSVFGTDFETAEYLIDLYGNGSTNGGGSRLIGGRTEFYGQKHVRINAGTNHTMMLGHRFIGGPSTDWVVDSGTQTMRLDVDSAITMNDSAMWVKNNVPIKMYDVGGTDRQVLKWANNDTLQIGATSVGNYPLGVWNFGGAVVNTRSAPAYSASVAINAALGNLFDITATNGTAFTVANPTNAPDGQVITITIRNTSGGALGVLTWDTLYKAPAWTQPANGFSRSAAFKMNGTNWVQLWQSAADVPN